MSINQQWFSASECGPKCRSRNCVAQLNAVITKANLPQVKAYVQNYCPSSTIRCDLFGRYPIHIAASCGKTEILDWLISTFQCDLNRQDEESRWTALHRALYYGRLACAVLLIEYGTNMWIRDKEGLTAMDISAIDCTPWVKYLHFSRNTYEMPSVLSETDPSEVYSWGVNDNFVLGHRNLKESRLPEPVEFFGKRGIFIKQVAMAKFHSVFVSKTGSVFACGHGEGGRLGNGHQDACLEPTPMILHAGVEISSAAIALDHTVLVTVAGHLLTCGLNRHYVLGMSSSSDRELVPARVYGALKHLKVVGCAAGALHTVAWTENRALYTFGTNAGQLGHAKGDLYVKHPRQVSSVYNENDSILYVHACDSATIIATKQGNVYLLQNYVCRKIISKQLDIEKVQVGGGRLDVTALSQVDQRLHAVHSHLKDDSLHVMLRKKSGDVLSWSRAHGTLDRCKFNLPLSFLFKDIILCNHGHTALLITNKGQAYIAKYGNWRASKPPRRSSGASFHAKSYDNYFDMLDSDAVQEFTLEQVSSSFRAHKGALGPNGKVGTILQTEPRNFMTEVPFVGESELQNDLRTLWENGDVYDLKVTATDSKGKKLNTFKCHRYVLGSRSPILRKLVLQFETNDSDLSPKDDPPTLVFENCDPTVLQNVMELLYCKSCHFCQDEYKPPPLAKGINSNNINIFCNEGIDIKTENGVSHAGKETVLNGNASAYAVYQKQGKNRKGKKGSNVEVSCSKNALSVFKTLVKKLGLNFPAIESIALHDGIISSKRDATMQYPQFDRRKFQDMCDLKLECSDGVLLDAHKCILVARVEFFRSMLLSQWAERSAAVCRVPVPSEVFKHVLEYIYSDSSLALNNISSLEILCEVMAAADQLLMNRLKEMVEVQVASLVSLKNVSSIAEFASTFHCEQLKKTCEQFICHHLPALLHTPHFYSIEYATLEQVQDYYRSNIDGVYMRMITPDSEAPCLPEMEDVDNSSYCSFEPSLPADEPISWPSDGMSSPTKKQSFSNRRRGIGNKKKSISKSSSYGVTLSELLSRADEKVDSLLDQITSSSVQPNQTERRPTPESVVELPTLVQVLENEPIVEECSQNVSGGKYEHPPISTPVSSTELKPKLIPPTSFKDIMAAEKVKTQILQCSSAWPSVTPTKAVDNSRGQSTANNRPADISHGHSGTPIQLKSKKLSQKQRKKLAHETARLESDGKSVTVAPSTPANAWGVTASPQPSVVSFWDVVTEQSISSEGKPANPIPRASSPVKQAKSPADSPWQSVEKVRSAPRRESSSFRDIMQNEQHQTDRALKQKNKPMQVIQVCIVGLSPSRHEDV